jgi:hypothetical protein
MKDICALLCFTVCLCATFAGCIYLVMHEHPWFAFFVLCIGGSLRIKTKDGKAGS